jgi:hypothetical protein
MRRYRGAMIVPSGARCPGDSITGPCYWFEGCSVSRREVDAVQWEYDGDVESLGEDVSR